MITLDLSQIGYDEALNYPFKRGEIYVASSSSSAYWVLQGYVYAGVLELLGQEPQTRGEYAIAVQLKSRKKNPRIGIDPAYFQKVLLEYSEWRLKWWREVVQNSVDAGATKITATVQENLDGTYTFTAADNGRGMSEDVLFNKFLVMGGTTKQSGGGLSVGGFGKAKELLLFPWLRWSIATGDILVEGFHDEYTSTDTNNQKPGVTLEVVMPADKHTSLAALQELIYRSNLPGLTFQLVWRDANGEIVKEERARTPRRKLTEIDDFDEAKIFTQREKRGHVDEMWVRVNGLYMFAEYVGALKDIRPIVEVTGDSTLVLTANRDGIRSRHLSRALDKLRVELAKDTRSRLSRASKKSDTIIRGTGTFKAEQERTTADMLAYVEVSRTVAPGGTVTNSQLTSGSIQRLLEVLSDAQADAPALFLEAGMAAARPETAAEMLTMGFRGDVHVQEAVTLLSWAPDFRLMNEIEDKAPGKRFTAGHMTPGIKKILRVWTELCRFVLIQLGGTHEFGVGFVFSHDVGAAFSRADGTNWLLLNPYKDIRWQHSLYRISNFDDLKTLYAMAIHEATHMVDGIQYHDEAFATAMTHNVARTVDGVRKIRKIARHA